MQSKCEDLAEQPLHDTGPLQHMLLILSSNLIATQVRRFDAHKGPVNDLCFDETAEFIGSCSDDSGAMVCQVNTRILKAQCEAQMFCHCRYIAYTQMKCSSSNTTAPSRYAAKHAPACSHKAILLLALLVVCHSYTRCSMHSMLHMCCDMQSMALDPRYGSRKTREFMTGGLAGQVALNSRVSTSHLL